MDSITRMLVVGSNEAIWFKKNAQRLCDNYNLVVTTNLRKDIKLEDCLEPICLELTRKTNLVLLWALTPYTYRRQSLMVPEMSQLVTVFEPDTESDILKIVPPIMDQIVGLVEQTNPKCKVYLVLPALKDTYSYNRNRIVKTWGSQYATFLDEDPTMNPVQMRFHAVRTFEQFKLLKGPECIWTNKNTISCQWVLSYYYSKHIGRKAPHIKYLRGETLAMDSPLFDDGLLENEIFFEMFLKKFMNLLIYNQLPEHNPRGSLIPSTSSADPPLLPTPKRFKNDFAAMEDETSCQDFSLLLPTPNLPEKNYSSRVTLLPTPNLPEKNYSSHEALLPTPNLPEKNYSSHEALLPTPMGSKYDFYLDEEELYSTDPHQSTQMNRATLLEPEYETDQPFASDIIGPRNIRFDKIVVLGNSIYRYYLEQLISPEVCIIADDISTEDLPIYIKGQKALMPQNTLWVLVTGIEFLFSKIEHDLCSEFCIPSLQLTQPTETVGTISKALNTLDGIKEALNSIERDVKRVLNSKSDFMLFPPIPPAMIVDSLVSHSKLHKLMLKYPKSYIVTKEWSSYFSNIFEKVSLNFANLTLTALNNMGVCPDPLEKYLNYQLNQIDFIDTLVTSPSNKLPFFREWLNTFKSIVSSCVDDSSCFVESSDLELSMTSRIFKYSSDDDDDYDRDFANSKKFLYESEYKPLPDVKSRGSVFSRLSEKNERQDKKVSSRKGSAETVHSVSSRKRDYDAFRVSRPRDKNERQYEKVTSRKRSAETVHSSSSRKRNAAAAARVSRSTKEDERRNKKAASRKYYSEIARSAAARHKRAAVRVSSPIKGNDDAVSINVSDFSNSKPRSKRTLEKYKEDPKLINDAKKSFKPTKINLEYDIYDLAADSKTLKFTSSLESDAAKPEFDLEAQEEMESEIFDCSEEDLVSEIFNDLSGNFSD